MSELIDNIFSSNTDNNTSKLNVNQAQKVNAKGKRKHHPYKIISHLNTKVVRNNLPSAYDTAYQRIKNKANQIGADALIKEKDKSKKVKDKFYANVSADAIKYKK